jgi:hypothetical protein
MRGPADLPTRGADAVTFRAAIRAYLVDPDNASALARAPRGVACDGSSQRLRLIFRPSGC